MVVVVLAVSLAALAVAMEVTTYNVWGAFWVCPTLLLLTVPVANRVVKSTGEPGLGRLVMLAAVVKVLGGSVLRYWAEFELYGGNDAAVYHEKGSQLAPLFRAGIYDSIGEVSGTRFAEILTGQVYALIGTTRLGGFMVFSWLAFLGLVLFWRAFTVAIPGGDSRRYALLIFFFPTLLFWTSAIGKDAWMTLCLGAAAWGFASLLRGRIIGALTIGAGLWGAAIMRPHLVLILLAAAISAVPIQVLSRRRRHESSPARPRESLVLLAVLILGAVLAVGQAERFFKLDTLDVESAEDVADRVGSDTGRIGGSRFDSPSPADPLGYVSAVVTVLFRPFPFEVSNAQGLGAALEGVTLLVFVLGSYRSAVRRLPAAVFMVPYATFAVAYTATFIYLFSAIGNFGILVRQRAQVLPLLFVVMALGGASGRRRDHDTKPEMRRKGIELAMFQPDHRRNRLPKSSS